MSGCIPRRVTIWLMLFGAIVVLFTMRTSMSIAILAMVEPTSGENVTAIPDFGPRHNWSQYDQSLVLGAFYWSYALSAIPCSLLIDKYDWARQNVAVSLSAAAVLTLITPLAVAHSLWLTVGTRVLLGLLTAGAIPAVHNLINRWSPAAEKGRFLCVLTGNDFGTVLAWSACGWAIEAYSWPVSFYGNGAIGAVFALLWCWVVRDSAPLQDANKTAVASSGVGSVEGAGRWPPLGRILCSAPCWALICAQFGQMWAFYLMTAGVPRFVYEVLQFDMRVAGLVASASFVVRPFGGVLFAWAADVLCARGWWSTGAVRKGFTVFSHILAGLCFLLVGCVSPNSPYTSTWCIGCLVVSAFLNGAALVTSNQNAHDLGPNYVTTLSAVINAVSTTSGFATPLVIAAMTEEQSTMDEWLFIFALVGGVYIGSGLVFIVFGSVQRQPWNDREPDFSHGLTPSRQSTRV